MCSIPLIYKNPQSETLKLSMKMEEEKKMRGNQSQLRERKRIWGHVCWGAGFNRVT